MQQEIIDSVEIERALETQRLVLLRLLTGLALVVAFVSCIPAVSTLPQGVRFWVASLLPRMESGIGSLVIVAACILSGHRVEGVGALLSPMRHDIDGGENVPAEQLLRRIAMLRAVLNDLPRYAKRLLKRLAKPAVRMRTAVPLTNGDLLIAKAAPCAARVERPPDKNPPNFWLLCLGPLILA